MRHVLLPPALSASPPPVDGKVHDFFGQTMGTVWAVRVVLHDQHTEAVIRGGIEQQLDIVVKQMSHWLPDSNLSQFNQAPADSWHVLPDDFFNVLTYALNVAAASDGAYDPTAGALIHLWGFGATQRHDQSGFTTPDAASVQTALRTHGWQKLLIDREQQRAYQPGGLLIDLSAVAKGYAVDLISHYLNTQQVTHHLVEVGGELRGLGIKPDALPWWVALEQPPISTQQEVTPLSDCVIALHNLSVATSGDYRRYFDAGHTRFSHTLDPRTGKPIQHGLTSVTVIHRDCMAADALSTALSVLGVEQGMAFAQAHDIAARFVLRSDTGYSEHFSPAFMQLIE